jgi:hypothetical protein
MNLRATLERLRAARPAGPSSEFFPHRLEVESEALPYIREAVAFVDSLLEHGLPVNIPPTSAPRDLSELPPMWRTHLQEEASVVMALFDLKAEFMVEEDGAPDGIVDAFRTELGCQLWEPPLVTLARDMRGKRKRTKGEPDT